MVNIVNPHNVKPLIDEHGQSIYPEALVNNLPKSLLVLFAITWMVLLISSYCLKNKKKEVEL